MPSITGVLNSASKPVSGSGSGPAARNRMVSGSMSAISDAQQLEDAMRGVAFVLADDLENAESSLDRGNSPYHKLGIGVVWFMKAVLGFQQDDMRTATEKLALAESVANDWKRRSQKDSRAFRSDIYPAGSEYAICNAEAQIMSAIVGVLTESLTEAVKGFYKIRKAISTLDGIEQAEKDFMRSRSMSSLESSDHSEDDDSINGYYSEANGVKSTAAKNPNGELIEPDVYEDTREASLSRVPTLRYLGYIESSGILHDLRDLRHEPERSTALSDPTTNTSNATDSLIPASEFKTPIELFVAGAHALHHGMLLLMLSLVPPTFAKLLSIVGFQGDRDRGLQLLWRATTFDGVNGGTAAMLLLGYYTNIISLLDIVPPSAFPRDACMELLTKVRKKYPKSRMWSMHESRILAADHNLDAATKVLEDIEPSSLYQIESIRTFEYALNNLFLHRYEKCADAFLKCIELNSWSHALYYYVAGVSHVELYRTYKYGDLSTAVADKQVNGDSSSTETPDYEDKAQYHARKAEEYLGKVTGNIAKKRFLSRTPPFDAFVSRKIGKWTAIANDSGCSLVDAVGVSPAEEVIYFWGGYKRMGEAELHDSLARLRFSDAGAGEDESIPSPPPEAPLPVEPEPIPEPTPGPTPAEEPTQLPNGHATKEELDAAQSVEEVKETNAGNDILEVPKVSESKPKSEKKPKRGKSQRLKRMLGRSKQKLASLSLSSDNTSAAPPTIEEESVSRPQDPPTPPPESSSGQESESDGQTSSQDRDEEDEPPTPVEPVEPTEPAEPAKPQQPQHPNPTAWTNPMPILQSDDYATLALLRAAIYRQNPDEVHLNAARRLLENEIIDRHTWSEFKTRGASLSNASGSSAASPSSPDGGSAPISPVDTTSGATTKNCDSWPIPCARYELAVVAWEEVGKPELSDVDTAVEHESTLKECAALLDEVSNWETFDLDTRIGMKISAGRESMRALKVT